MKKLITTCAFLMLVTGIYAISFNVSNINYNSTTGNNVEVTSKSPIYTGSITIPSTVVYSAVTYNVTSIGTSAFNDCSGLTSITIPSSVTSIGANAFFQCSALTTITIPSSVTSIGYGAFFGCTGLTSITISNYLTSIGSQAFGSCTHLTSITIPSSVTSIGSQAFGGCTLLTSIVVDVDNANYSSTAGVLFNKDKTTIVCYPGGGQAVYTIPSSVTSIGDYAFESCSGLTSITIPSSVTSIGTFAFYNCTGLTSITIPSFVTSIGDYAFESCSGLTSVDIQGSVTSLGAGVFYQCTGLTSIAIPSSVTLIGSNAFMNCSGLTSVTIPSSVTSIGSNAFYGCSLLTTITIPSSVTSIGGSAFDATAWYTNQPDGVVYAGTIAYKYKGTMPASTSITLNAGTTGIAGNAFSSCTGLTSITIPSSVTSIGSSAFMNCSGLTSITIPSSVTSIGSSAFQGCSSLTSITIPSSVTSIGDMAFRQCSGLTTLTCLSSTPPTLGTNCFFMTAAITDVFVPGDAAVTAYKASSWGTPFPGTIIKKMLPITVDGIVYNITSDNTVEVTSKSPIYTGSITIPSTVVYSAVTYNVTAIGYLAFQFCNGLTSISIPSSVTSIGANAFQDCSALTSISIPSSVTSIGNQAFANCTVLASITIPSSVTSIGDQAFTFCIGLTSITIPSSVTSIGESAFYNCTGLTSVTIPSSVTSIGVQVFYSCTGLTFIAIPSSVTSIGYGAFYGCIGLTSVTIPSSVTSIGSNAFYYCTRLTSITIPSYVTSIGSFAFYSCTSLTTLTCLSSTPPTLGDGCFNSSPITDVFVLTDEAVTDYITASWGGDAFTGKIKKVPTSSLDGNWSASDTWPGGVVPTTGQPVVIANAISLDVNTSVSDLIINNGYVLNVNAGKQLTVSTTFTNNGTLNLLSTAGDGTATILTPATISGSGTNNVQQFLNGKTGTSTRANWYLSSPVSGATVAVFDVEGGINKMTSYNEVTTSYLTQFSLNSTTLTPGVGYVTYIGGADDTYTFTGGGLNNGDIPVSVTRTGATAGKRGFNLVGNPYPSYLDWNAVKAAATNPTNVRPTIWYRTLLMASIDGTMTFDTYDGTTGTSNGANGVVSQYISPMQTFWMKVDGDNSSATLNFANGQRSHQNQSGTTNRLRAAKVNTAQIVRLKVSNGINGDEAIIVTDPNALDGFDNYDSQKMSNANVNIPEIFTLAGSEELVINHVNSISANKELTLGFRPGKTGDFTIEATEISNLDSNLKVMLLDKLMNTQQEIKVGSPYSFSSDATATNNRFSVLFKVSSSPTGLGNPSSNGDVTVYRNAANHVTVVCNANVNEKSLVSVYNAVGQQLIQQKLTGKVTEINKTFMPGIYIVSVNNGGQSVTKKIIIN